MILPFFFLCINVASSFQISLAHGRATLVPPLTSSLTDARRWIVASAPSSSPTTTTALKSMKTNILASITNSKLSSTLPACPTGGVLKLAVTAGCVGLGTQIILTALFSKSKKHPTLQKNPGYTAHTVVAFILMVLVSYIGIIGYYFDPGTTGTTAIRRVLTPFEQSKWLGAVITGMFVAWDIPTSLLIPKLRKPDVIIHHVLMAIVACMGATVMPMRYMLYYFGVAELSSIPLLVYDQLSFNCEIAANPREEGDNNDDNGNALERWRDRAQIIAAVAFTLVRAFHFTKVTAMNFIPDVLSILPTTTAVGTSRILKSLIVVSVGFASLQLYWFSLMVRVMLGGGKKEEAS
jgi:hypothetical protein